MTREPSGEIFDRKLLRTQLLSLADRMMRGHIWLQGADKAMRCTKRPLALSDVVAHTEKNEPFGLAPIRPGESTTQIALLDMDSHKGEVPWRTMVDHAKSISSAASDHAGLRAIPFRSTGGSGVHLMFVWATPQDAYSVRQMLVAVLERCGFKSGTKGVAHGEIEVFPKQDRVPEDGFGSMFILPYSRKSCALDPENELVPIPIAHIEISDNVPTVEKPERPVREQGETPELARVWAAMRALPEQQYDYEHWRNIVFSIHDATEGSDEGLAIAQEYNDTKHQHERGPGWLPEEVWPHIGPGEITAGTLFHHAREAGWRDIEGATDGFEDVPDAPEPRVADQPSTTTEEPAVVQPLPRVDIRGLSLYPPAQREWIVPDWLARGVVTGLFSRGGMGKTLVSQQLATCIVMGIPWLGIPVVQGKVLGIFCEEDDNDLRWRQKMIMGRLDPMDNVELDPVQLGLVARLGGDNTLMHFDAERKGKRTKFFKQIEAEIEASRPDVVILDNVAQLFAGIENDRSQVTMFVNALARWARDYQCAILLLGHTAKAEGSSFSGSTAWENVTRVRWVLKRDKDDDTTSTLAVEKSNLGARPSMVVAFDQGVFITTEKGEVSDSAREMRVHLLTAVNAAQSDPEHEGYGSHKNHQRYLPRALVAGGNDGGWNLEQLERCLKDLVSIGFFHDIVTGKHRNGLKDRKRIEVTPAGNQWLSDNLLKGNDSDDLA